MKPEFRMIETNGIKVRAAVQGEGPLIVMVHGFPESWYSWRHQMAPLAAAGFTACAIDVRGYGGSDKPHAVEAYAMKEIAADVAGVIEALSPGKPAVLIGHDWGAPIVWHTTVLHPKQVRAVAGLSVPWFGLPPMSLDALIKANKDFDLLLLPNQRHGYGIDAPYVMRRRWDYFVKNLLGVEPPKEYKLPGVTPPGRPAGN